MTPPAASSRRIQRPKDDSQRPGQNPDAMSFSVVTVPSLFRLTRRARFKAWLHRRRIDRLVGADTRRAMERALDDAVIGGKR